jgi:hypothetical protein
MNANKGEESHIKSFDWPAGSPGIDNNARSSWDYEKDEI